MKVTITSNQLVKSNAAPLRVSLGLTGPQGAPGADGVDGTGGLASVNGVLRANVANPTTANAFTLDQTATAGVAFALNGTVLLTGQTTRSQNRAYTITAIDGAGHGTLVPRDTAMAPGQTINVRAGFDKGDWTVTSPASGGITPGVTDITWSYTSQVQGTHATVIYARWDGDDANTGRTFEDGVRTGERGMDLITAAGGGTLRIFGTQSNPVQWSTTSIGTGAVRGLRILGSGDPNIGSPPPGWRVQLPTLTIEAYSPTASNQNNVGSGPVAYVNAGHPSDIREPAVWLSGCDRNIVIKDIYFTGPIRLTGPSDLGFASYATYAFGAQPANPTQNTYDSTKYIDVAASGYVSDITHCPPRFADYNLTNGSRVLLWDQGNVTVDSNGYIPFVTQIPDHPVGYSCGHAANGPHVATYNGDGSGPGTGTGTYTLTRVADFSNSTQLQAGMLNWVRFGDHAGVWLLHSPQGSGTMGVTAQEWHKWKPGSSYTGAGCNTVHVQLRNVVANARYGPALHIGYTYNSSVIDCKFSTNPNYPLPGPTEDKDSILRASVLCATDVGVQSMKLIRTGFIGGGLIVRGWEMVSGTELSVEDVLHQSGSFGVTTPGPTGWIRKLQRNSKVTFKRFLSADAIFNEITPAVRLDGTVYPGTIHCEHVGPCNGSCIVPSNDGRYPGTIPTSLQANRQIGTSLNTWVADNDCARDGLGGAKVITANLVNQDPTTWATSLVTPTYNVDDGYGGKRAASFSSGSTGSVTITTQTAQTIAKGGIIVARIRVKGPIKYAQTALLQLVSGTGWQFEDPYLDLSSITMVPQHTGPGWQWLNVWAKIKTVGTVPTTNIKLTMTIVSSGPHAFCFPIISYIPPGATTNTWDDNEAARVALCLAPTPHVADVGAVSLLADEDLQKYGGHTESRSPANPTLTVLAAAGNTATASVPGEGTDEGFILDVNHTGTGQAAGRIVLIDFRRAYNTWPLASLTPMNAAAAANAGQWYMETISKGRVALCAGATPSGSPRWKVDVAGRGRGLSLPESFSPYQWFRGDSYTAGTWTNKLGTGHDVTQPTGSKQPAAVTASANMNSQDSVSYDGVDDGLFGATAAEAAFLHQQCIILLVFDADATNGRTLLATNTGLASQVGIRIQRLTTGLFVSVCNGSGTFVFSSTFTATGSFSSGKHCAVIAIDTISGTPRLRCRIDNDASVLSGTYLGGGAVSGSNPTNPLSIGCQGVVGTPANSCTDEIGEVILCTGTVTSTEMMNFRPDYINGRYAI